MTFIIWFLLPLPRKCRFQIPCSTQWFFVLNFIRWTLENFPLPPTSGLSDIYQCKVFKIQGSFQRKMFFAVVLTFSVVSLVELCSFAIYPSAWYEILIPHLLTPAWTPPRPCVCAESPSSSEGCERINNNISNKCCQMLSCFSCTGQACWLHGRRMGKGRRGPGVQVGSKAGHLQTNSSIQGAGITSWQHGMKPV